MNEPGASEGGMPCFFFFFRDDIFFRQTLCFSLSSLSERKSATDPFMEKCHGLTRSLFPADRNGEHGRCERM